MAADWSVVVLLLPSFKIMLPCCAVVPTAIDAPCTVRVPLKVGELATLTVSVPFAPVSATDILLPAVRTRSLVRSGSLLNVR